MYLDPQDRLPHCVWFTGTLGIVLTPTSSPVPTVVSPVAVNTCCRGLSKRPVLVVLWRGIQAEMKPRHSQTRSGEPDREGAIGAQSLEVLHRHNPKHVANLLLRSTSDKLPQMRLYLHNCCCCFRVQQRPWCNQLDILAKIVEPHTVLVVAAFMKVFRETLHIGTSLTK